MSKQILKVTIEGKQGSGKSRLAKAIVNMVDHVRLVQFSADSGLTHIITTDFNVIEIYQVQTTNDKQK